MTAVKISRDLRQTIIDEATRLFAEQGFSATSVREVAAACECTKPSLYYYFENKEALFRAVIDVHVQACSSKLDELSQSSGSARECLNRTALAHATWAEANPYAMRLLQRIETQPEDDAPEFTIAATRELHLQLVSSLIERGMREGEIRSDLDPFDCALVLAGSLSFQFEMALGTELWDRERLIRTIDMIFDGIAA